MSQNFDIFLRNLKLYTQKYIRHVFFYSFQLLLLQKLTKLCKDFKNQGCHSVWKTGKSGILILSLECQGKSGIFIKIPGKRLIKKC